MLVLALTACFHYQAIWSVAVLCLGMFVVGWLSVDINIKSKTTVQLFVDPAYLGKVLGLSTAISYILIPLSLVIAGGISEIWPSYVLPMLNGILLIVVLTLLWLGERKAAEEAVN